VQYSVENFLYGAIDGAVSTFAIVTGVVGASLSPSIILILGFANLLADGFSMAIGNYLAGFRTQYSPNGWNCCFGIIFCWICPKCGNSLIEIRKLHYNGIEFVFFTESREYLRIVRNNYNG